MDYSTPIIEVLQGLVKDFVVSIYITIKLKEIIGMPIVSKKGSYDCVVKDVLLLGRGDVDWVLNLRYLDVDLEI